MKAYRYVPLFLLTKALCSPFDVTVVGPIDFADGIGRLPIGFIETVADDLKVNCIVSKKELLSYQDLPSKVKTIIEDPDKTPGTIALHFDLLWDAGTTPIKVVPQSPIKIAYSALESTAIPPQWVTILNKQFDAVIVPDKFLKGVYTRCGVLIPIFVQPFGLYLDTFLSMPIKKKRNGLFTFGMSAAFYQRKNFELLIQAFAREFGNKNGVQLVLHGKDGLAHVQHAVENCIRKSKAKNIFLIKRRLKQKEYVQFMASLDCYVFLSKGEGFSNTPREALALGIPCIISNNTAHSTLCSLGFVKPVPASREERAYYDIFRSYCGTQFNCTIQDAQAALKSVYNNYTYYLLKAYQGRTWTTRYLHANVKKTYLTLIKPQRIILGATNEITNGTIVTTSKSLYEKYSVLISSYSANV